MSKRKLSCHCGGVEGQVEVPENGFEKISANIEKSGKENEKQDDSKN